MPESTTAARPSAWEWARASVLSANIVWTTLCLGGFLPGTRVAMIIMTAVLLALQLCDPEEGTRVHPAGLLFIPFLFYGLWNLEAVSQVRWIGWMDLMGWTQAIAVFWVVLNGIRSRECRRMVCMVIVAVAVASAGMAAYQHFMSPKWLMLGRKQPAQYEGRSTGSFGIPNSLGVFMALLIPPVSFTVFSRGVSRPPAPGCLVGAPRPPVRFRPRRQPRGVAGAGRGLALRSLFMPGRSPPTQAPWRRRGGCRKRRDGRRPLLHFPDHEGAGARIRDRRGRAHAPDHLAGCMGDLQGAPGIRRRRGMLRRPVRGLPAHRFPRRAVYAHCDYLNTLCDYGVVGFVLLFGASAVVAWKSRGARASRRRAHRAPRVQPAPARGLPHEDTGARDRVLEPLGVRHSRHLDSRGRRIAESPTLRQGLRDALRASSCCARLHLGCSEVPGGVDPLGGEGADRHHGECRQGRLARARRAVRNPEGFRKGPRLDPLNAQAWSDKAYAETLWGLVEPAQSHELGMQADKDASAAIALSPIVAEFWVRKGSGLDLEGEWFDGGKCFAQALQLAPSRADIWYYQAYHYSLHPVEGGPALEAVNLSLRLDPGFLLAQSLRQRLGAR
jgi:hypothetical protein